MSELICIETKLKMPLMQLPVRTVLVQTDSGSVLISPGSRVNRDDYKSTYNVTDIVAPNSFHQSGVPKAASIYPEARLWASDSPKKRKDIPWTHILGKGHWIHSDLVPMQIAGIPKINEFVFLSKPSKSLIVADLCFNMQGMKGLGPKLILSMFGTYNKFAISKFFLKFMTDKKATVESIEELMSQDFDNIIPSHGEIVRGGAKDLLFSAFQERQLI